MLTGIEDSAARIKQIITELKDFARPAGSGLNQQVDSNVMVTKSLDLTRSLIKKSTRNLSVDLDEKMPLIFANSQKLQQVIINLIVNACQALENPEQAITVSTRYLKESNEVLIMVADTGPGITRAELEKIKEPFFIGRAVSREGGVAHN